MGYQWIITFVICLVAAVCRLWAVEAGECRGFSGEASVWPREAKLQKLLVLGPAGDPEGLQGNAVHQRPQVDTQTQCPITSCIIRPPAVVSSFESQVVIDRSDSDAHILPLCPSPPQPDDQHHAEWHHQHAAVAQYGEILEGSACYLCDAQTGGGAPKECPVQETTNHR